MSGRITRMLPILLVAALAACGGTRTVTVTETVTTTATVPGTTRAAGATTLRVYLLRDGKVAPVAREVPGTPAVARAAVEALLAGPTAAERAQGLTSALPAGARLVRLSAAAGLAQVSLDRALPRAGLAQLVYTLTQFPSLRSVRTAGRDLGRGDLEDLTPAILVESPLPGDAVSSPLHATGTANTFEATFDYELADAGGRVVSHRYVTATSGSGTRGTFAFDAPFAAGGPGTLTVFERSAEDGRRLHTVAIPVLLTG